METVKPTSQILLVAFIVLRMHFKGDYGFYEYTYQNCEYIIRTMNT